MPSRDQGRGVGDGSGSGSTAAGEPEQRMRSRLSPANSQPDYCCVHVSLFSLILLHGPPLPFFGLHCRQEASRCSSPNSSCLRFRWSEQCCCLCMSSVVTPSCRAFIPLQSGTPTATTTDGNTATGDPGTSTDTSTADTPTTSQGNGTSQQQCVLIPPFMIIFHHLRAQNHHIRCDDLQSS